MIKPDPSSRHPLVLFLLALCLVSGLGIFLGQAPAPGSLNASLPEWEVLIWAAALGIGAVATLLGIAMQPFKLRDGVLLEQVGMACLAPAAMLYGVAAFTQVGISSLLPSGIILGLGVSCGYRWFTLQRDVRKSKHTMDTMAEGTSGDGRHRNP